MTSEPRTAAEPATTDGSGRLALIALAALFSALLITFSIIQPLGRTPDEAAHMQYVQFLAEHRRLPIFAPVGSGEGGYEAQHPPFYYAVAAVVHAATGGLEERWRWHVLRWWTALLVGGGALLVCLAFFRRLWPDAPRVALLGTAATVLMPLTILYAGYINPDGLAFLLVTVALYLSLLTATEEPSTTRAVLLGLSIGAAALTKLSAAVAVVPAICAWVYLARDGRLRGRLREVGVALGIAFAFSGWWYIRNLFYYGTPFIHTAAPYGSALDNALASGRFGFFAWLAARETYLSTWIQRGWLPAGPAEWCFYGFVTLLLLGALVGWSVRRTDDANHEDSLSERRRRGAVLSLLTLVAVVAGQQSAFWLSDVEFNAGGRYALIAMAGIIHMTMGGWSRLLSRRSLVILFAWFVVALVLASLLSAWQILAVLNPRYAPGWQFFHFPPG